MMPRTWILLGAALMTSSSAGVAHPQEAARAPILAQNAPTPAPQDTAQDEPQDAPQDAAPAGAADTPPWAVGVPEDRRNKANAFHARGLKAAKDLFYTDALNFYRQALDHWDHPKIRYNTAFVLIKLGQPIEARENLLKAVAYGDAPLGRETYHNALSYLDLLNKQLAEVVVRCDEPDVEITLDGEVLLRGSGAVTRIVSPGEHQLVAKTVRLPAMVHRVPLWAEQRHDIRVHPSMAIQQRWATWKPWAVAGAGATLLGVGGLLHWRAQADFDRYDREVLMHCSLGCSEDDLPASTRDLERRAMWENRFAGTSLIMGSAILATGVTLLILNQPRLLDENAFGVSVVPMAGPSGAGVSAQTSF